ncbi:nuclear transport factor 2 family protein [Vibrio sp. SCSIO 43135]|uniref:nuclear transport factor 2 family protein n=1 Tax=Vibrio sp. SCSIO 43135 TaxID=2819096 RepID=UPI0020766347|nr:nuclear transport factor 2 family protein [Vibrio sp. SCSIO 43135]USD43440.1 nuclear transport factor 2 family protein [Vibrio sp. SCSIO 43135]
MGNSLWLQRFVRVYSELGTDNLGSLNEIYHPDVQFIDPMHHVSGREDLLAYFDQLYTQIISCQFVVEHVMESGNEAAVYWTMTFSHFQLNGKAPVTVQGHSHLKAVDDQVIYHRDYLDVGAMLYEHIPLLGKVIRGIKRRAAKS